MHANLYRILLVTLLVFTAAKGEVVSFTSMDLFLEAVDDIRIIDFATLPDGSPSVPGTPITPEFNYTDQGVMFGSFIPGLMIVGDPGGPYGIANNSPSNLFNHLTAVFTPPVFAVAVTYGLSLSVFDSSPERVLLATASGMGETHEDLFVGFVSDVPIGLAVGGGGEHGGEAWLDMYYSPVPEPATLVLFAFGAAAILWRKRRLA